VKRTIPRVAPGTNLVDCAITDVDDPDDVDAQVLEVGEAVYAVGTAEIDMLVEKYGQTTQHTFGEVTDVDYETNSTDGFYFDQQVRIVPVDPTDDWSAGGDSGSLVFSQTATSGGYKPAVGLHWGGSGVNGTASKIQNVFSALDVTTICAGLFSSFLDGLFETEVEGEVMPLPVTSRGRGTAAAGRFHRGMSRDIQERLETSRRGRLLTGFVDAHRAALADMLLKDGDVRRATAASLRPILAGATTSTQVLQRSLTADDLKRLSALAEEVGRRGGKALQKRLTSVRRLAKQAEGKTVAELLGIEP
jgi:hypothetical protein